ncbi:MAG: FAD-linked oxidase C-terminal domain-containing protein [Candidatus Bathyarchaeia archaeon]
MKTAVRLQNSLKTAEKNRSTIDLERIVARIRGIVGPENVLTDEAELVCYSYDASLYSNLPDVVVFPGSDVEVSEILRLANEEHVPVTPRGSGTSLSGGPVPVDAGIVIVLSRMNRILDFDIENLTVTCEVGITLKDLNRFLSRWRLFFPIDPGSAETVTLGGMIGENAAGMHSLKYGKTRDRVLDLEVVLPTGKIVSLGSRCYKCASGYDFKDLFIGSEGTLGVVTKATLKISPIPEHYDVVSAAFKSTSDAGRAISEIVRREIPVSALEFMDEYSINVVRSFTGLPLPDAAAMVLVECQGLKEAIQGHLERIVEILNGEGAFEVKISKTRQEADQLWYARKVAYGAITRRHPTAIQADPVVPVSRLPDYLARLDSISKKYSVQIISYGHAGDGNLHPTVMVDERNMDEMDRARQALAEIYRSALELGGTLTGEHGIGVAKSEYFRWEWAESYVDLARGVKTVLDPNNIMNPGKWI